MASISGEQLIWRLCYALIAHDAVGVMRYGQQFMALSSGGSAVLIGALAKVLRRIYGSLCAHEHGLADEEIRSLYGIRFPSRDRAQAGEKSSRFYLGLLKELAELDQGIKDGTIPDSMQAVDCFLVKHL